MANWCKFTVFTCGKLEDIKKFDEAMKASSVYNYNLSEDFEKNLNIFSDPSPSSLFYCRHNCLGLDVARSIAKKAGNDKACEMLKDENLTKDCFASIPNSEHFCNVLCYDKNVDSYGGVDGCYGFKSEGVCAWSLAFSLIGEDDECSYQELKKIVPLRFFKGVNLVEFAKTVPSLKMAFVSQETDRFFSEFYLFLNGEMVDGRREYFDERFFNEIHGIEDEGDKKRPLEFPEWYELKNGCLKINEDYVLTKLGC